MIKNCRMCEHGEVKTLLEFNGSDKDKDYILGLCQECGTLYKKDKGQSQDLNMILTDNSVLATVN